MVVGIEVVVGAAVVVVVVVTGAEVVVVVVGEVVVVVAEFAGVEVAVVISGCVVVVPGSEDGVGEVGGGEAGDPVGVEGFVVVGGEVDGVGSGAVASAEEGGGERVSVDGMVVVRDERPPGCRVVVGAGCSVTSNIETRMSSPAKSAEMIASGILFRFMSSFFQ